MAKSFQSHGRAEEVTGRVRATTPEAVRTSLDASSPRRCFTMPLGEYWASGRGMTGPLQRDYDWFCITIRIGAVPPAVIVVMKANEATLSATMYSWV